ncbi:MAG: NYN domain-containing protein [Planctomycetes bacterium]|nr:NYN domain-containing protein [Planctomycetota bacterium]
MPVIVDGYNLLRAIQKAHEQFESVSDVQLCRILGRYLKSVGEKGEIIFDGIGPPDKTGFDNISNLEVFFVGFNTDADSVIEDKIKANTAPKRLAVVSSDRRIRSAAQKRKATSLKSDVFWDRLQKQLSRKRTIKEPKAKRAGLTESETEQWLKIFGIEQ